MILSVLCTLLSREIDLYILATGFGSPKADSFVPELTAAFLEHFAYLFDVSEAFEVLRSHKCI